MIRSVALLGSSAVLAAAGCGGGDEPSRDEFISKAKAICAAAEKKRAAQKAAAGPSAEERFPSDPVLLKRDNDVSRDAIAKLKALEAPEEERAGLQKVITIAEQKAAATDALIAALKAKNREAQQRALMERETADDDVAAAVGATELAGCEASL